MFLILAHFCFWKNYPNSLTDYLWRDPTSSNATNFSADNLLHRFPRPQTTSQPRTLTVQAAADDEAAADFQEGDVGRTGRHWDGMMSVVGMMTARRIDQQFPFLGQHEPP